MAFLKTLTLFILISHLSLALAGEVFINPSIQDTAQMPFEERANGLALNVEYDEVLKLREEISHELNLTLRFFDGYEKNGEAHVTVITPPEFNLLKKFISQNELNKLAKKLNIQSSDLQILGIGSGKKIFDSEIGETFFLIVKSRLLLDLRVAIQKLYVAKGGSPVSFDPFHFYPHVTIGFTHKDIHEPEIYKDLRTLDSRFKVILK